MKVTVATCCYEKDYKLVMQEAWLNNVFSRFNFDFYERILVVNMKKTDEVSIFAQALLESKAVDNICYCEEYVDLIKKQCAISSFEYLYRLNVVNTIKRHGMIHALRDLYDFYFSNKGKVIKKGLFKKLYDCSGYLLGPLTALLNAQSEYLLYFTEDCAMESNSSDPTWITNGISLLRKNERFIAVRPYDSDLDDEWSSGLVEIDDFKAAYTFTDRMFLTDVNRLKSIDYNSPSSHTYPAYGGNGFEARVYNYMKHNDLRMLVHQHQKYIHESEFYRFDH